MENDTSGRDPETVRRLAPSWRLIYLSFLFTILVLGTWGAREVTMARREQLAALAVQDSIRTGVRLAREATERADQNSEAIASGVYIILQRLDRLETRNAKSRRLQTAAVIGSLKVVEAKVDTVQAAVDTVAAVVVDSLAPAVAPKGP